MRKIFLVIKREYLARVKKRSFLLATLLTPLIFPTILGVFLWIAYSDMEGGEALKIIEVVDDNNLFFMESSGQYAFTNSGLTIEEAKKLVQEKSRFGFLHLPKLDLEKPVGIVYYSNETPNMALLGTLENTIKRKIEDIRLFNSGIDPEIIASLRTKVSVRAITLGVSGKETVSDATVNYAIGFITGILIYTFIFVYGNQIMQGVIEEKSSRIVEILVSSLKPFQLMMGKIIGIGAVGLTQFLIWIILIGLVSSVVMGYFGMNMPQQQLFELNNPQAVEMFVNNSETNQMLQVLSQINYYSLIIAFVFYFIGGYLLYGAFFAAIGAAVDSPSDAQQFMFPVTIPLIIAYLGLFVFVLDDPGSKVSYWLSIVPFTSPIAMMGRISYGVPFMDILISAALLVIGFLFTTWLAGKIYRIGILVHGSKVNYKTLWKWIKQ